MRRRKRIPDAKASFREWKGGDWAYRFGHYLLYLSFFGYVQSHLKNQVCCISCRRDSELERSFIKDQGLFDVAVTVAVIIAIHKCIF